MPAHGFKGNVRYGVQTVQGTRVPAEELVDMPDYVRRVRMDAARNYHDVEGIGSSLLLDQQLLMRAPTIEMELEVTCSDFIALCVPVADELSYLTLDIQRAQSGANLAHIWTDCLCNSLRLAAAQREPLRATCGFWPLTETLDTPSAWGQPLSPPFAFVHGTWSLGGEIIGVEIDLDNGLTRDQYISTAAPADPYAPTFTLLGKQKLTARIRSLSIYDVSNIAADVEAILAFDNGAGGTMTITLTNGAYRGQEHDMSGDGLQQFSIPMTFQSMTIA